MVDEPGDEISWTPVGLKMRLVYAIDESEIAKKTRNVIIRFGT